MKRALASKSSACLEVSMLAAEEPGGAQAIVPDFPEVFPGSLIMATRG